MTYKTPEQPKKMRFVIGIDQSTQGTKAILVDSCGEAVSSCAMEHEQIISKEGWVSHDGEEIFRNTVEVIKELIDTCGISRNEVAAIGISNQRETTLAWNRRTGEPVGHAIVWQCSRAAEITQALENTEFAGDVFKKTGIPLSPFFPAAKAAWILQHNLAARSLASEGNLCIGTIDSWLVFKLTGGAVFKTDYSNASRTQLFNIRTLNWDEKICGTLGIPLRALPTVDDSDGDFGTTTLGGFFENPVPIRAVMGDSHAALFGQGCTEPGMAKATYGTGSSVMMNIGTEFKESSHGLVTSLAWGRRGRVDYVLEGNINYAGAVVTWLQKDLGLIKDSAETEKLALDANPADETYLIPAFSGLGAPYWKSNARAMFCGMSRTTGRNELVKAALDSIAYQVTDVVRAMCADAKIVLNELRTDGGPSGNGYLMQFQSDIARVKIFRPLVKELSAIGAAYMAGIATRVMDESILHAPRSGREYVPVMSESEREKKYAGWKSAINRI